MKDDLGNDDDTLATVGGAEANVTVDLRTCKHCLLFPSFGKWTKGLCLRCWSDAAIRATYPPVECRGLVVVGSTEGRAGISKRLPMLPASLRPANKEDQDGGGKDALPSERSWSMVA